MALFQNAPNPVLLRLANLQAAFDRIAQGPEQGQTGHTPFLLTSLQQTPAQDLLAQIAPRLGLAQQQGGALAQLFGQGAPAAAPGFTPNLGGIAPTVPFTPQAPENPFQISTQPVTPQLPTSPFESGEGPDVGAPGMGDQDADAPADVTDDPNSVAGQVSEAISGLAETFGIDIGGEGAEGGDAGQGQSDEGSTGDGTDNPDQGGGLE